MTPGAPLIVRCPECAFDNTFDQPYPYHAGFGDQGFLYNEAGNCTLVWGAYDPSYVALVGQKNPWVLSVDEQGRLEDALRPSPYGDRWLFRNPPRCLRCRNPIGAPIGYSDVCYLVYAHSVSVDGGPDKRTLEGQMYPQGRQRQTPE